MMPRTGGQIREMQHAFYKAELEAWVEDNRDMLSTLVFVCKSGMLKEVEKDLFREHWLPTSNKYVHNVSRAFFGFTLTRICDQIDIPLLQLLTEQDPDAIWKLLYKATHMNRNTKVPTLHKLSYCKLLEDRHTSLGSPLQRLPWKTIRQEVSLDREEWSIFKTIRNDKQEVTGILMHTGDKYEFPRPQMGRFQLVDSWCLPDCKLQDPEDEEDPILIIRRFKKYSSDLNFSKEEIDEAEKGMRCISGQGEGRGQGRGGRG